MHICFFFIFLQWKESESYKYHFTWPLVQISSWFQLIDLVKGNEELEQIPGFLRLSAHCSPNPFASSIWIVFSQLPRLWPLLSQHVHVYMCVHVCVSVCRMSVPDTSTARTVCTPQGPALLLCVLPWGPIIALIWISNVLLSRGQSGNWSFVEMHASRAHLSDPHLWDPSHDCL